MGGTAAAILSNSPSAGIGTGGLVRPRRYREGRTVRSRSAPPNSANTTAPEAEPSRPRRRPGHNSPCPEPRANACSSRERLLGLQRQRLLRVHRLPERQQTMRRENGCQHHHDGCILTIRPDRFFAHQRHRCEIHRNQTRLSKGHIVEPAATPQNLAMMLAHFMLMLTIMMMELHSQRPAMQPGAARDANSTCYGQANFGGGERP